MRPIKLTISAFGPYASKQVIDFEELKGRNIFVISGKTGAGKTTIFDAISYALYGEASGESRETDSLRSHFADDNTETYVELEFELRGEKYTVNRVPKQKKKKARGEGYTEKSADATLTLPDGKVITKVKNVTDKIIEILGITREQFKQIVMLAQGEFKKLLLADSVEREGIFRKIFNTYDFEKIQAELKDKAANLSKNRTKSKHEMEINLKNIKGEHDIVIDEYVDFPLVIEKLKDLLERDNNIYKTLNEEGKEVDNNLQVKNQEKAIIETNNNLLKEKEIITKALEELLSKEDEYKNKSKTIIDGKNAKEVKYIEDKLIETTKKLTKREEDYNLSLKNIDSLKLKQEEANKLLQIEESKECDREKLSVEINNLNKLEEKIIELDSLNNKVMHLKQSAENSKLQIINNKKETEELKKSKEEKELQLKDIATLETKKVELESDIKAKNKTLDEVRELFKVIRSFQNTYIEHNNKAKEYKEFEVEYKKVKENYEKMDDLYKKEQAGILASKLQENEPCPVCGSTNHPNKATIKENLKIPTKEELKVAKENLDKLEKENLEKINNLTTLNSNKTTYLEQVNNHLSMLSATLNIDKTFNSETAKVVKNLGTELKSVIDKLKDELLKVIDKISLKEKIEKELNLITTTINEREQSLIKLEECEKNYTTELTQNITKIDEYKKEIPENITDLKTLNNLIEVKTKELNISKEKLAKLRLENENLAKKLEGENSTSKEINKSIEELKLEIANNKANFNEAIKEQGFDNIQTYEDAKLQISMVESLEKEVENYNSELKLTKAKQEDIINKTKDIVFMDITTIDEEIRSIQNNKKELESKLRELHAIIVGNKTILKNVENLNIEFKEIEEEYKVVGELADLANGKKAPYISFERYILASYFEDIIEAANIRLEKMTGDRFSLIRKTSKSKGAGQKGLELEIYDNYTDSSRDVSSLSGGESFKASLSLALGLSDIVQSNAGGVSLDTMFVDEGFGTLDPQSLDNAIDSLLELQRGGRLVGIISHVEELKERIDAKLEVTSTSKGSKVEFNIL
ncbi:AAA family ATPase [Romboutsia timonensis]|uniref:AAA family ATPase n=2 Tax=Romboutsia timonensis TaxID=1776391 RepID=UPI002E7686E6|nr:AAA family ATPase [Romboutsia timonensis]MEE0712331.1 SbcC/MukB-like Walker B domain-containing protein [Romboutsia timonensis]